MTNQTPSFRETWFLKRLPLTGSALVLLGFLINATHAAEPELQSPPEPTYGGRTMERWSQLLISDLQPETRLEALLAIGTLGHFVDPEQAIQTLLEGLASEPVPEVRSAAYAALLSYGDVAQETILQGLAADRRAERQISLYALADFFAPLSADAFGGNVRAIASAEQLPPTSQLPAAVLPELISLFSDPSNDLGDRETAARTIGGLFQTHPQPAFAEEILEHALNVARLGERELSMSAIRMIGMLGQHAAPAIPQLIEFARRQEVPREVRRDAARYNQLWSMTQLVSRPLTAMEALANLGPVASGAIPALERLGNSSLDMTILSAARARDTVRRIREAMARAEKREALDASAPPHTFGSPDTQPIEAREFPGAR